MVAGPRGNLGCRATEVARELGPGATDPGCRGPRKLPRWQPLNFRPRGHASAKSFVRNFRNFRPPNTAPPPLPLDIYRRRASARRGPSPGPLALPEGPSLRLRDPAPAQGRHVSAGDSEAGSVSAVQRHIPFIGWEVVRESNPPLIGRRKNSWLLGPMNWQAGLYRQVAVGWSHFVIQPWPPRTRL